MKIFNLIVNILSILGFFFGGFVSSLIVAKFVVNKKVEEKIKTLRKENNLLQNEKYNLISNIDYIIENNSSEQLYDEEYNEIFCKKDIHHEVMNYTNNMINKCKRRLFNIIKSGIETNDIFENDWSKPV